MPLYEAVHARPDGTSTVSRLALTASEYGYDGLVVRNHGDVGATYDATAIGDTYNIDVVRGVEIRAEEASQASGFLGAHRDSYTIVCLHGGELNRFGVDQPRLDVLAHPMRGGDVNHVLAQAAAENGIRLEFNLSGVLRREGEERVHAVRGLRKLADLVRKYDVPYVVSADASSHLELRAPRDLIAVGELLGFGPDEIRAGLGEWGRLADRNRERCSDTFLEPGVRRGRFDQDRTGGPGG